MKTPAYLSLLTAVLLAGCGNDSSSTKPATTNAPTTSANALMAPADYVTGLADSQKRAVKTIDVAALNQAVQLFEVQEGRLPKNLNELVEKKLISYVPDAPTGMKITYDAASGIVKVVNAQ